jgi:hypothetical protein
MKTLISWAISMKGLYFFKPSTDVASLKLLKLLAGQKRRHRKNHAEYPGVSVRRKLPSKTAPETPPPPPINAITASREAATEAMFTCTRTC